MVSAFVPAVVESVSKKTMAPQRGVGLLFVASPWVAWTGQTSMMFDFCAVVVCMYVASLLRPKGNMLQRRLGLDMKHYPLLGGS